VDAAGLSERQRIDDLKGVQPQAIGHAQAQPPTQRQAVEQTEFVTAAGSPKSPRGFEVDSKQRAGCGAARPNRIHQDSGLEADQRFHQLDTAGGELSQLQVRQMK
jgi:hypothetical protein